MREILKDYFVIKNKILFIMGCVIYAIGLVGTMIGVFSLSGSPNIQEKMPLFLGAVGGVCGVALTLLFISLEKKKLIVKVYCTAMFICVLLVLCSILLTFLG